MKGFVIMEATPKIHVNEPLKMLCEMHKTWKKEVDELSPRLAELNRLQEEILHLIEIEKLNAPQKAKAMKKLTEVRKERREVHQRINDLNYALSKIKFSHTCYPQYTCKLTYTYHDELIEDILGE